MSLIANCELSVLQFVWICSLWLSQYVFFRKIFWIPVSMVVESCLMIEMIPVPNVGESGIIGDSSEFLPGLFVLKHLSTANPLLLEIVCEKGGV